MMNCGNIEDNINVGTLKVMKQRQIRNMKLLIISKCNDDYGETRAVRGLGRSE